MCVSVNVDKLKKPAAQLFQVYIHSIVRPKTKYIIHTLLSTEKKRLILIISMNWIY